MNLWVSAALALICAHAALGDPVVIRSMADIGKAVRSTDIVIEDLFVPAGVTLRLFVKTGTKLTFKGKVTFGYAEWQGPLILIKGSKVTITGEPGNLLDGDGKRWWDGKGGHFGKQKPRFMKLALRDSTVTGLNIKNLPVTGLLISSSRNVVLSNINIDVKEGDWAGATNTDGFDVSGSYFITIKNNVVYNQDDCFACVSGSDVIFENNFCSGGHGISIGSVGGKKENDVSRITMRNNKVVDSDNGIRIKTNLNGVGSVKDITFQNIELSNIRNYGITVQGNYLHTGPTGEPTDGVPISGLIIDNVWGNVLPGGTNILVWVKNASNWKWVSWLKGGQRTVPCQGFPQGFAPLC